jgi:hypothetical protein
MQVWAVLSLTALTKQLRDVCLLSMNVREFYFGFIVPQPESLQTYLSMSKLVLRKRGVPIKNQKSTVVYLWQTATARAHSLTTTQCPSIYSNSWWAFSSLFCLIRGNYPFGWRVSLWRERHFWCLSPVTMIPTTVPACGPSPIFFDHLQISEPRTMSLFIGVLLTTGLCGYLMLCYLMSFFVSVRYRRDTKSHRYTIAAGNR